MSYTVDVAQGLKTRGIVTFLLIAFGLDVRAWALSLAHSSLNIVGGCIHCGGDRVAER